MTYSRLKSVPKLSHGCPKVVPKSFQCCPKVEAIPKLPKIIVPKLTQSFPKVAQELSLSCFKVCFLRSVFLLRTSLIWKMGAAAAGSLVVGKDIRFPGGANKFWKLNWELYGTWFDEEICLLRLILFAGFTTSTNTDWCYRPANLWYSANRTLLDSRVWWIGLEKTNISTAEVDHSEWIGFLCMNL